MQRDIDRTVFSSYSQDVSVLFDVDGLGTDASQGAFDREQRSDAPALLKPPGALVVASGTCKPAEAGPGRAGVARHVGKAPDRDAADRWCAALWGDSSGYAILGLGVGVKRAANGRFIYSRFSQKTYCWPQDRDRFLDEAMSAAPTGDVFVGVLLRDAPTREVNRSRPCPGRYAWLDADGWDDERQTSLQRTGRPVLTVASGRPGHLHLYVDLGELLPGVEVATYAQKLAGAYATDSYGGNNKLLRLPGTFNHKPTVDGEPPAAVRWVS